MTRPEREVVIVAHRGMAAGHPENTLAAFRHSISAGFPVIEVDLRTTADGHIVIMHDETVDRTTSGTGEVGQMTLAEIRRLDAGSHAGPRFAGEPVPTYPEALQALQGLGSTLVLDIKPDGALDNEHIVRLTEQHGATVKASRGDAPSPAPGRHGTTRRGNHPAGRNRSLESHRGQSRSARQ